MKDRGKAVAVGFNFSAASEQPCTEHRNPPSSVGVCPFCLRDKLLKLLCSTETGRISFLIEKEGRKRTPFVSDNGLWKIGRLFGKRKDRNDGRVSRSRSVSSAENADVTMNGNWAFPTRRSDSDDFIEMEISEGSNGGRRRSFTRSNKLWKWMFFKRHRY
ncbi:hypothetical protein M569_00158 [Genlisea aurea]|uniref:Uncharacterized protein n=1 Tax=Genlisea aurea TaxID=192259 RepID=S8ENY0_9LAMI|nr:hypothetical protein M569_00158 [Genlisea aurea]